MRETYTMQVHKTNDITDQRFETILDITDFINSIIPPTISHRLRKVEESRELMKMLQIATISDQYVNDIIVYFEGDDYVYTSTSTYSLDNITNPKFYFSNLNHDDFKKYLDSTEPFILIPQKMSSADGHTNQILLGRKLIFFDKLLTIFFAVDSSLFDSYQNKFILYDDAGTPIYYNFAYEEDIPYNSLLNVGIYEEHSDRLPLKYISFPPDVDLIVEKVNVLTKTFYYFMFCLIIISIFGVYWGMTLNYSPAKQIEYKDDITSILIELLKGKGIGQFERNKKLYNMEKLNNNSMFIICFTITDNRNTLPVSLLEKTLNLYLPGYLICLHTNSKYCFMGSTDEDEEYERIARDAWIALSEVNEEMDIAFSISNLFKEPQDIKENYENVENNLHNTFIYGNHCFLTNDEHKDDMSYKELYSKQYTHKLVYLLKSGELEKVNEFIDDFSAKLKQSKYPIFYIKALCFNIVNSISQSFSDLPILDVSSYFKGNESETIDDLIEGMRNIAVIVVNSTAEKDMNNVMDLVAHMDNYLTEHVYEKDFSLQKMADDFNMTPSTLSSFYKKNTGKKMIDIVSEKRLSKAAMLLLQDYNITEVISKVGYYNESSFIRKFKEYFGVTPKNYANIMTASGNRNREGKKQEQS